MQHVVLVDVVDSLTVRVILASLKTSAERRAAVQLQRIVRAALARKEMRRPHLTS